MAMEKSLVVIKPDAMARNLQWTIIDELESLDIEMVGIKIVKVEEEFALRHYDELKEEFFFPTLIKYITGQLHGTNKVVAICYEGEDAVAKIRTALGATNPEEAKFTDIRGKYGRVRKVGDINLMENVVHASSSAVDGEREVSLWFKPEELIA